MTVYVESNFVLELALLQEQHENCDRILRLAEERRIRLVVPAYSLVEPFETLTRRFKKRQSMSEDVRSELKQLGRSAPYEERAQAFQDIAALFVQSQEDETQRLHATIERLCAVSELIPLNAALITDSLRHHPGDFSSQDSVVYASVHHHLSVSEDGAGDPQIRNSKDFDNPDVQDSLEQLGWQRCSVSTTGTSLWFIGSVAEIAVRCLQIAFDSSRQ